MTSDDHRHRAAIHEAGHAIVGVVLGSVLVSVTLSAASDDRWGGAVHWTDDLVRLDRHLATIVGGIAAENVVFGAFSRDDIISIGVDLYDLERELRDYIPYEQRRDVIRAAFATAESILESQREALDVLAARLEARGQLTPEDVTAVLGYAIPEVDFASAVAGRWWADSAAGGSGKLHTDC